MIKMSGFEAPSIQPQTTLQFTSLGLALVLRCRAECLSGKELEYFRFGSWPCKNGLAGQSILKPKLGQRQAAIA
ncbi:hypothetical protein, partial [Bradyrhizobium sp. Mp19]